MSPSTGIASTTPDRSASSRPTALDCAEAPVANRSTDRRGARRQSGADRRRPLPRTRQKFRARTPMRSDARAEMLTAPSDPLGGDAEGLGRDDETLNALD